MIRYAVKIGKNHPRFGEGVLRVLKGGKGCNFSATGLMALIIAILTVSGQALKAATANPAKAIQNE